MTISIHPKAHVGTLRLDGKMNEEVALEFEAGLELLCDYYHFEQLTLEINSTGGQVGALEHMLASLDRWRRLGRMVSTQAHFRAGSAAAMLLAMGDIGSRAASISTTLHFHTVRVDRADAVLTAQSAVTLGALLHGTDRAQLRRLMEHQIRGFGGWHALATEGAARCAHLAVESGRRTPKPDPRQLVDRFDRRALGTVAKAFAQCLERRSSDPYQRLLARRFALDLAMPATEAWALCLLDSVAERPYLRPHQEPAQQGPRDQVLRHLRATM